PDAPGRLVELFSGGRARRHTEKWAVQDISFDLPRGSALGVIGANGAGKSSLLKLVTGVTTPTTGRVEINGRLSSLLELGAGFHPSFSGRDNVFMNAAVMGIPKAQAKAQFDDIVAFADLGEYLEHPVRTYSSGMAMRLGFAVAMMANPDILILDEVLAVGDHAFQQKCMERISEIRRSGTTVLFVSHAISQVRRICDRCLWVHDGRVVMAGDPTAVTDEYSNYYYARSVGRAARLAATGHAVSAAIAHLTNVKVCPAGRTEEVDTFKSGDHVDFHLGFRNPTGKGKFHLGLIVNRSDEVQVFSSRSFEAGVSYEGDGGYAVVRVPLRVSGGEFYVSGFLLDESCDHILDQRQAWTRFHVDHDGDELGVFLAETEWLTPQGAS
ncbi:MAG: ATP-binding cassette domain-containing protein, partial [Planctomycetes bacterium]|nr:ATP-binding cassette domain-containing protein [Planctomycetota bacterium]